MGAVAALEAEADLQQNAVVAVDRIIDRQLLLWGLFRPSLIRPLPLPEQTDVGDADRFFPTRQRIGFRRGPAVLLLASLLCEQVRLCVLDEVPSRALRPSRQHPLGARKALSVTCGNVYHH